MGCARSRPSCCRPPRKRHHEDTQPPGSGAEQQELGPLDGDAAAASEQDPSPEVLRILQQHEEDKERWTQQVEQERERELQERLKLQRGILDGQRQEALQALQASHKQEKEALIQAHQKTLAALQETVDSLTARLEAVQAQMKRAEESVLSRDYKQHFQDHGGLSEFWERELESLHFVIEMRNERVHELDKRLTLMETVREKNLTLEEKVSSLQQENEDLCARFRKQTAVSRQLSEDLLAARQALEQEQRLRQELQQEKEELLFRVLGAQAGSAFPLAPVAPTPTQVSFLAT